MINTDRRNALRMPLQVSLTEYVADEPRHGITFNVGPDGLYLNRLRGVGTAPAPARSESGRIVRLEFEIPGTPEPIWAEGEICFDCVDCYFHGSGVRFVTIAETQRRLIEECVTAFRGRQLRRMLATVRRNRARVRPVKLPEA